MSTSLAAAFGNQAFIIYRAADKTPVDPDTLKNSNPHDAATHMPLPVALGWVAALGAGFGVGIVITEDSQLFAIDLDGCLSADGVLTPIAHAIVEQYRKLGAYIERSMSKRGVHIIGSYTGPPPLHACKKPAEHHFEMYTKLRYIALTGDPLGPELGNTRVDCSDQLWLTVYQYFRLDVAEGPAAGWTTAPLWHVPGGLDDDALIAKARRSKSAAAIFGDRITFEAVWTADADELGKAWPGNNGAAYDASSADQSLANRLMWWTGGNCERVETLMRRSALAREKWGRRDYIEGSLRNALAQIAKKPPIDKSKPSAAPALALSAPPPQSATPAAHEGVTLISAATIEPEAIDWLWHSHIALGKLSILAGVAGTGKSTVAFNLAAIVSVGGMWPDGSKCPTAGNVLIWSGEDDPADTIIPRLMAADADLSRIHIITGGKAADGTSLPFDPASDVTLLCDEIKRIGGAALMIIDPIVSAVAGDMHKANDVRRGLQAIIDLSAAFDCAVVGVSHFSKGSGGASPQERVIGSQAFAALARLVLVCAKDEGSSTRVLMRAKSNISVDHGGFKYGILPVTVINRKEPARPIGTTKVEWGEALRGNAREILKSLEPDTEHAGGKNDECAQSMRAMLTGSDGSPIEVPSSDVQAKLCEQGYSEKCIRKAKERLGVTHRREGFGGGSYWRLPVPTPMVRSAAFLTTKSP